MPLTIIDTPQPVQRWLPRLTTVQVVIRYITSTAPNSSKCVTVGEVKAIAAAGKQIGIVHEAWGDIAHAGHGGISSVDGVRDGRYARKKMNDLGAPQGACVYFAIDTDLSKAQINKNALPYFNAIAASFADGFYTVGIYGPGAVCAAVLDAGLATYGWLSNAKGWAGYAAFLPRAAIVQLPVTKFQGLDIDPNIAQALEWGQWAPVMPAARVAAADPMPNVTAPVTEARLGQGGPLVDVGAAELEPEVVAPAVVAAAATAAVTTAATAGATPAAATAAGVTAAENVGAGTGAMGAAATAVATAQQLGFFDKAKSIYKSKIAWFTGGLGATGAGTAAATDPTTVSAFSMLARAPAFWLALLCVILAGVVIYYRWRDHGRGAET